LRPTWPLINAPHKTPFIEFGVCRLVKDVDKYISNAFVIRCVIIPHHEAYHVHHKNLKVGNFLKSSVFVHQILETVQSSTNHDVKISLPPSLINIE